MPGVNGNAGAGDGALLDPNFRQDRSDEVNFTVQRSLSPKMLVEAGYIGRKIKNEFELINIDAVPYMTTLSGQSFASAYAALYQQVSTGAAVTPEPFFEAALGGPASPYCAKFASCTAAVASNQATNIKSTLVYNLWTALNAAPGWTLGRTLLSSPAVAGGNVSQQITAFELSSSNGYGNYNAAFLKFVTKDWHGMTARSNFTYGRALGTGTINQSGSSMTIIDPWNIGASYGPQPIDIKFDYNLSDAVSSTVLQGAERCRRARVRRAGRSRLCSPRKPESRSKSAWAPAAIRTRSPSVKCMATATSRMRTRCLPRHIPGGNQAIYSNVTVASGTAGINGNATKGGSGINMFSNPNAVYAEFRRPVLGLDTSDSGAGVIRGFSTWNLDATVSKQVRVNERIGATLIIQFSNILNHFQPANPTMNIDSPATWGVVTNQATTANGLQSRAMEFGLRLHF